MHPLTLWGTVKEWLELAPKERVCKASGSARSAGPEGLRSADPTVSERPARTCAAHISGA
ncbi:hypothetical protein GCM10027071_03490 [Microbacterium marinum]